MADDASLIRPTILANKRARSVLTVCRRAEHHQSSDHQKGLTAAAGRNTIKNRQAAHLPTI
jgi:hypothetical protein